MLVDAYTKAVLTVIAVALVLIATQPLYGPARAEAQAGDLFMIERSVDEIEAAVIAISTGNCSNGKLC